MCWECRLRRVTEGHCNRTEIHWKNTAITSWHYDLFLFELIIKSVFSYDLSIHNYWKGNSAPGPCGSWCQVNTRGHCAATRASGNTRPPVTRLLCTPVVEEWQATHSIHLKQETDKGNAVHDRGSETAWRQTLAWLSQHTAPRQADRLAHHLHHQSIQTCTDIYNHIRTLKCAEETDGKRWKSVAQPSWLCGRLCAYRPQRTEERIHGASSKIVPFHHVQFIIYGSYVKWDVVVENQSI